MITLGLSFTKGSLTDLAGGIGTEDFGSMENLLLSDGVRVIVLLISIVNHKVICSSIIFIDLMLGLVAAMIMGRIDFSLVVNATVFTVPIPFKFGFGFDRQAFIVITFIYIITSIKTSADLTQPQREVIVERIGLVNGHITLN